MLRGQNSKIQLDRLPVPAPHNHNRHPVGRKLIEGEWTEVTAQRVDFRVACPFFKTPVAVAEESGDKLPAGSRVNRLHVIREGCDKNRKNGEEPPFRC